MSLRPIRRRDGTTWREIRRRNADWLRPWEATQPDPSIPPPSFNAMVSGMRAEARAGRLLPFIVTYEKRMVGQLTMGGITYGSVRVGHIGYWIDRAYAGRSIIPTGVALASDHAFGVLRLHRIEISLRPENQASQRVVEKLGFRFEGVRPSFLHIDGEWRDHRIYALHADEVPEGMVNRWRASRASEK